MSAHYSFIYSFYATTYYEDDTCYTIAFIWIDMIKSGKIENENGKFFETEKKTITHCTQSRII